MKIYLKNYIVRDVMKRISLFDKYHIATNNYYDFFSEEGIFQVTNNAIYKMNAVDATILNVKRPDGHELIVDKSVITLTNCHHIPAYHIVSPIYSFVYQIKRGGPKLVIDGTYNSHHKTLDDKYLGFTPSDFYFDVHSETDDINGLISLVY